MIVRQEDHKSVEVLEFDAMNTSFFVSISNSSEANWREHLMDWFRYVEKNWSRFNRDSELTRINQISIGETFHVSAPLFDVLLKAQNYFMITDGFFSPYLLEQLVHHGYDRSFPFQNSEDKGIGSFQKSIPFRFNPEESLIERIAEGKIDLGGIGKGYAVESAAAWLKQVANADYGIVDGGGDLTVWSNGEKEWKIGIVHPLAPEKEIKQITVKNSSVATSNIVYRSWFQGEKKKHHILNGKTGEPVVSGIIQATAVTTNCLDAEVFTKLCFMEKGMELKELLGKINPIFKLVLVNEVGEILTTQRKEE